MEIDKIAVKRYLNCTLCDSDIDVKIDDVYKELCTFCVPKKLCVISETSKSKKGYYLLEKLGLELVSEDINKLFSDCSSIATLVVTLGMETDRKIAFYANQNVERCVILDAVANVYVESVLDEFEEEVAGQMQGMFKTMRYSPGYGDLDISIQKSLIERVQADKFLGINVSESYLMTPLKTITAFVGFSEKRQVFGDICLGCQMQGKCETKCKKANG